MLHVDVWMSTKDKQYLVKIWCGAIHHTKQTRLALLPAKVCVTGLAAVKIGGLAYIMYHPCGALQWSDNMRASVSNYQSHDCLLNCLFRRRSKKTSKLRVIGLCAGNSPGTGEFPAQMASNVENVPIWWRHHENELYGHRKGGKYVYGKIVYKGTSQI